jgi:hypothetical protein
MIKNSIQGVKMSELSRQDIESALREGNYYEGIPDTHWEIDGIIYLSKEEMPEDIRFNVERNVDLLKAYEDQKKRFCVNGIEYDTIEEAPKKYQDNLRDLVKNNNQEKYRLTVGEVPLIKKAIGFFIFMIIFSGLVYSQIEQFN